MNLMSYGRRMSDLALISRIGNIITFSASDPVIFLVSNDLRFPCTIAATEAGPRENPM